MNTSQAPAWVLKVWENPPDPVVYLIPQVADIDMRKIETKLLLIGLTFMVFVTTFIVAYFVSYRFVTFRSNLHTKEKVFWCLAFVRAGFGFLGTFIGGWFLAFDDILQKDIVNGHSQTTFIAVYICVGFFLFECIALYSSNIIFKSFDPFLFLHHTLSLTECSMFAVYGNSHFFAIVGLLLEMTTPFSCFCWMLLKAKLSHLTIWKINQMVLIHLFHSRTTLEGYLLYKFYIQWDNIIHNMPGPITFFLFTHVVLQFSLLTPYWTYRKMMQLFNPIDWNHPDLQSSKVRISQRTNGASTHPKNE